MTVASKATIKTYFVTNATPSQQNFTDFIDSCLFLNETAQTVSGATTFNGGINANTVTVSGAVTVSGLLAAAGGITVSGASLGTAAFLNAGVSANNLVQLDSLNRLPAVNGSLLTNIGGSVTCFQATDSTDLSLSTIPTQTNLGSTVAITIPTKGTIELVFSGVLSVSTGANGVVFGIRIGSTNYWPSVTDSTAEYQGGIYAQATGTITATAGYGTNTASTFANGTTNCVIGLNIEGASIPTGAQTVQIIAAKIFSNAVTIKGTTATSRIYIRVFNHN